MKNEIKILIAAIVVILIVLVGAFALSGSNTAQPTATPTAVPVTATPTPGPANGGNAGGVTTPSATPTATPTATAVPSATPTPVPESGVKQTEFGYWITYPPLDPQKWSTNPRPNVGSGNVVYFDPVSQVRPINSKPAALKKTGDTTVYRVGDMNGTVNVTIHASMSSNIIHQPYIDTINYDYSFSMHTYDDENMTGPDGNGDYVLTFGPGVGTQELCIHIDNMYERRSVDVMEDMPEEGFVKLTIVSADGGFSVGTQNEFLVSMKVLPEVRFGYYDEVAEDGELWEDVPDYGYSGDFDDVDDNGTYIDVFLPVVRDTDEGAMTVDLHWQDFYWELEDSDVMIGPCTFADGQTETTVKVSILKEMVLEDYETVIDIYIDDGDGYAEGWPHIFNIFLNGWGDS